MPGFWQPASFRGVPFFVEGFDHAGGRRGPDHEFPGRDDGYPEDTGGKIGRHDINAYVVRSVRDPDYTARRDALIAVLKQRGQGELVHPAWGTIRIQMREWSVGEKKNSLGLVPIQMSFVEASMPTYPTATRGAFSGMDAAAGRAHAAAAAGFSDVFSVAGKSDFLRASAIADAETIGRLFSRLASSRGLPIAFAGQIAALVAAIAGVDRSDDPACVAVAVAALSRAVTAFYEAPHAGRRNADGSYRGMGGYAAGGPLDAAAVMSLFLVFDSVLPTAGIPVPTATRRHQRDNAFALAHLTRLTAAVEAARVAPFVAWKTLREAETARDKIADALDVEAGQTASDELYDALTEMRILVFRTVPPEERQLPSLMDYIAPVTMPALALSFRLYGTSARADEIAGINSIRHAGFVPGMETVEVLSDVG